VDSRLESLKQNLLAARDEFSPQDLNRHPEGKWCAAEIFEHLYLTYTGTARGFSRVEQAGKPQARRPTVRDRLRSFVVVTLGYMPGGREAPPAAQPRGMETEKILAGIAASIDEMDDAITRCERKLGSRKLLDHPILGPLTASEWRKFHCVHGRHHLKQLQQLRHALGLRNSK